MDNLMLNNKHFRKYILIFIDIALLVLSGILSLEIRFDFELGPNQIIFREALINNLGIYILNFLAVFYFFGLYRSLWRYASINEMISVCMASFWGNTFLYLIFNFTDFRLPRSFYIINLNFAHK